MVRNLTGGKEMPSASLTSKGQITIPKVIRDLLQVKTGDRLDFIVEGDHVVLRPGTVDLRSLRGLLHEPGRKPVSLKEMDAAVAKAHASLRKSVKPR
jgi:AbrB family looped-hinge helix DNA binding protein